MKRITHLLILLFILFLPSVLNAQKFQFGLQSGLNVSNTHLANKEEFTEEKRIYYPLLLVNVNAYLGYKSESFWGVSLEPGYIQKGGLVKDVTISTGGSRYLPQDVKYITSFIQFPVLADFYVTKRIFISLGPEFSVFLSSKAKGEYFTSDISGEYDKIELSGIISINYSPLNFLDVVLCYSHGITSPAYLIWIDDFGNYIGRSKEYSQYLQLTLRFKRNCR